MRPQSVSYSEVQSARLTGAIHRASGEESCNPLGHVSALRRDQLDQPVPVHGIEETTPKALARARASARDSDSNSNVARTLQH